MSNFKQDIINTVDDDTIEAVRIESSNSRYRDTESRFNPGNLLAGEIISYEKALEVLDYDYDAGYGSQDCHSIYMWSRTKVYFIHEYDGSTSIESVNRNPY